MEDETLMTTIIPTINESKFDLPKYETDGASGLDLKYNSDETIVLGVGERHLFKTGLKMAIPNGVEGQIRPRSGLANKYGITVLNTPGTIDSDYRGEIMVNLINLGNEPFEVIPGLKIAQIVFCPVLKVQLQECSILDITDRNDGGHGSTGLF